MKVVYVWYWYMPCDCSLSAQPISTSKAKSRKKAHKPLHTSWISPKMYLPCLIIIESCYFDSRINKPFVYSHYMICISCTVHLIWTYYVCKGSWAFLSWLPTNQRGQKIWWHGVLYIVCHKNNIPANYLDEILHFRTSTALLCYNTICTKHL